MTSAGEGFHKEVSDHVIRWNVVESYLLLLDEVPGVVILYVDMLQAIMEYRVLRQSHTSLVVSIHHHWIFHRNNKVVTKIHHPYCFLRYLAKGHVFGLGR